MKSRRGVSIILALILSLSLTFSTFAADLPGSAGAVSEEAGRENGKAEGLSGEEDSSAEDSQEDAEQEETSDAYESKPNEENSQSEEDNSQLNNCQDQGQEGRGQEATLLSLSDEWLAEDFTYGEISQTMTGCDYQREIMIKGQGITGFSESGLEKIKTNKNLVIPSKMPDGTTIVGVGENAFKGQEIETVTFPENMMVPYNDTLTHVIHQRGNFIIKSGAFANNNLTKLNFPDGIIYIDSAAFQNNKLTSVSFPHTLWMIGNSAFNKNQLTSVQFYMNCDFQFQMDAFAFSNNKLKSITLPNYTEKVDKKTFYFNPGMEPAPAEAPDKDKKFGGVVYMYTSNQDLFNKDRIHHMGRTAESQKSWQQKLILGTEPEQEVTWKSADFTYEGTVLTGLSESGEARRVNDRDLVLPDKNPQGEDITEIAAGTIATCGVFSSAEQVFDSVRLPAKLKKIGDYAFSKNQLSSITFPDTLTQIGVSAFAQNRLTAVTLPDSVTTMGAGAFSGQMEQSLKAVKLSKNLSIIPQSAFAQNAITTLTVPEGVTEIGRMAFQSSPLTSLSLPSTLNTIGSSAFNGHELAALSIPGSLKEISSSAFAQNSPESGGTGSLKELELKEGIEVIASNAFRYVGVEKTKIPASLKKLNKNAFRDSTAGVVELVTDNYSHLTDKVNFPDSSYYIIKLNTAEWKPEDFTYSGTTITGLSDSGILKRPENKDLVLPDKTPDGQDVEAIADASDAYGTFGVENEVFTSVKLPSKLKIIGAKAFLSNRLTSIEFPKTLTSIGLQAFALNDLSEIKLPDSVVNLGGAAFSNNIHISAIELSDKMETIPGTAFGITLQNVTNSNLSRVVIPEGVKNIDSGAFGGHEIQTLVLPVSLKTIGSRAFKGNQLETLVIPSNVTELGSSAFEQPAGKSRLSAVKLPEGLLKINSKTFANGAFTRVDIPFSLTTLNKAAFAGNTTGKVDVYTPNDDHLKFEVTGASFIIHIRTDIWTVNDFTYEGTAITGLSDKGIRKRAENRSIELPDKNPAGEYITEIKAPASGEYGTFGAEGEQIENVKLPAAIVKIGDRAFQGNLLSEIVFPETLKEIGLAAFQSNRLVNITLPDNVTSMGGGAFASNKTIQSVTISKNLKEIPAGAFGCSTKSEYMEGFSGIEIPEGVEKIGDNAFAGNNFTDIRIPSTVESIGNFAFSTKQYLSAPTTLSLPEGLTSIGSRAFRNQNIAVVDLPYSVESLSKNVFEKEYKDQEGTVTKVRVQSYIQYTDKDKFPDSDHHVYEINADSYTVNDFTFDDTTVTGLSQDGIMKRPWNKNLVVPDKNPKGEDITDIAAGAAGGYGVFGADQEGFVTVVLPAGLKTIGNFAFRDNGIQSVEFPNSLKSIGIQAFAQNQLENIVIPDSVSTLGGGAFTSNQTLKSVKLSKNIRDIPASAFLNNTAAKDFTSIEIPEGIETIGNLAFSGNSFTEVTIPSTVTKIGKSAFAQTDDNRTLAKVTLPSGLIEIGSKAFKDSQLDRIDIPKGLKKLAKDVFFNTEGRVVSVHTSNKDHLVDSRSFYASSDYHRTVYNQLIESGWTEDDFTYDGAVLTGWSDKGNQTRLANHDLVLPSVNPVTGEDIISIGEGAFKIPDDEWEQGKTGIYSPNGMEHVLLPERLQTIKSKAFQYNSLTGVDLPETTYSVGESAFNSNKIKELVLPDTITDIQSGAFSTNVIEKLVLSKGLNKISQAAFSMNIELTYVEIPDTITEIGEFAFAGARLETLDIPASVTKIGKKAFHLHHLEELTIPGTVKEIGESAFEGTFKAITLKKLTLEEGIEKIGPLAFKEGYLEKVDLPSTLLSMGADVFYHNSGINNNYVVECYTTNPAHMKFQNSDSHKIIYQAPQWDVDDFTFDGMERRMLRTVGDEGTTITGLSASGLKKLNNCTDIVLPQRNHNNEIITAVGEYAFANLPKKITSIVLPEGLKEIRTGAFQGNALQELKLPESLESIGEKAFAENRITEVTLPENVSGLGSSSFDGNKDPDGNPLKVTIYITNNNQENLPGSDGYEIVNKNNIPGPGEGIDPGQNQVKAPVPVSTVKKENGSVNTGDEQKPEGYLFVMTAAAILIVLTTRRRRKYNGV